jgi:acyl-CoA dehydrogenase
MAVAIAVIVGVVVVVWAIAYFRVPFLITTILVGAALAAVTYFCPTTSRTLLVSLWVAFLLIAAALNLPPLRRALISNRVLGAFRRLMPPVSATEREALEAGTVWWEAQFFTGRPKWKQLLGLPRPNLSADERAFLDGPVEELCRRLNDWEIVHDRKDLPPELWAFLKAHGFFGMIIPKKYSGLEFSAQAHSEVVLKIASRSLTAAVTVMVPNSLGPAELLMHYGTEAQKNHYLPRLARGEEIPCQNSMPGPLPLGSGSLPTRLHTSTGMPLAIACAR